MNMRAVETVVLHASDIIFWLDATSAATPDELQRVDRPLNVEFDKSAPGFQNVEVLHKPGKTAVWRNGFAEVFPGQGPGNQVVRPTGSQRVRPTEATFSLSGTVSDPSGRYNPRTFSIAVGNAAGPVVSMYPTPIGTQLLSGGLIGTLRLAATGRPLPWAVVRLNVTLIGGASAEFQAQSDQNGDFTMAVTRLPPLPASVSAYDATLSIRGLATASAETPLDPSTLIPMEFAALDQAATFAQQLPLQIRPGAVSLLRSFGQRHLTVQPV
jgi:hypothetical protein